MQWKKCDAQNVHQFAESTFVFRKYSAHYFLHYASFRQNQALAWPWLFFNLVLFAMFSFVCNVPICYFLRLMSSSFLISNLMDYTYPPCKHSDLSNQSQIPWNINKYLKVLFTHKAERKTFCLILMPLFFTKLAICVK